MELLLPSWPAALIKTTLDLAELSLEGEGDYWHVAACVPAGSLTCSTAARTTALRYALLVAVYGVTLGGILPAGLAGC